MAAVEKIGTAIAPSIGAKIAAAEIRKVDLEAQIGAAALDEETGKTGATSKRERLEAELAGTVATIARLGRAQGLAIEREARAAAEVRAKQLRDELVVYEGCAERRLAAMVELCVAIEAASAAYRRYIAETEKMTHVPSGCTRPRGSEQMLGYAEHLIAGQMYKYSGISQLGQRGSALPGARPPTPFFALQPAAIDSAAETVRGWNAHLVGSIRQQVETIVDFAAENVEAA